MSVAFIPVPNTVEVVIEWNTATKPVRTVFNVTFLVATTIALMEALASDIVDAIVTNGLPWMSNVFEAATIGVTDLSTASAPSFTWTTGSGSNTLPFIATGTSPMSSGQAALVTTLRTLNRGRSFRGRNYWPGLMTSQINADGKTIAAGRVSAQEAFVNTLIAAVHSNPNRAMVVVSRQHNGVRLTTGVTTPITSHDTNNIVDTQRRRVQN